MANGIMKVKQIFVHSQIMSFYKLRYHVLKDKMTFSVCTVMYFARLYFVFSFFYIMGHLSESAATLGLFNIFPIIGELLFTINCNM